MRFKHADTRLLGLLLGVLAATFFVGTLLWPTARTEVLVVVSTLFVVTTILHVRRSIDARLEDNRRSSQAYNALLKLLPLRRPLPPMTGWAASPELAATLFSIVRTEQPQSVLELGSGASTIVVGYALEMNGAGHITSLDHDSAYLSNTVGTIRGHGLTNAEVLHAPLADVAVDGGTWRWYDLRRLNLPESIDLLIVDGPPRETGPRARYPALPLLLDHLSADATVVLDDADRGEESAILTEWQRMAGWSIERVASAKGVAVLRRVHK